MRAHDDSGAAEGGAGRLRTTTTGTGQRCTTWLQQEPINASTKAFLDFIAMTTIAACARASFVPEPSLSLRRYAGPHLDARRVSDDDVADGARRLAAAKHIDAVLHLGGVQLWSQAVEHCGQPRVS